MEGLHQIDLNGAWQVTHTEGMHGWLGQASHLEVDEGRYLTVSVPGEIHAVLQERGLLADLNVGLQTLAARWVENQWWQYRRWFSLGEAEATAPATLVCEGLDYQAIIYMNGVEIGRHANAHRPCRLDVTGHLRAGRNLLAVEVESGLYYAAERPGQAYSGDLDAHLTKRHWLRKAQYESGWDWHPRLLNVGITGSVWLDVGDAPRLHAVTVLPALSDDRAQATLEVRAVIAASQASDAYELHVRIADTASARRERVTLAVGENRVAFHLSVANPRLWWPRGHGEQYLYTVETTLERAGAVVERRRHRTGIRQVRIMQDPHPVEGRYCLIEINGRPIFCKGGNWVPPDMIPSRVTPEHLRALITLATGANFNFLRIWGGGVYAGHDLLDLCDDAGILVWHDLPFACTRYPSDDPAFLAEARTEITWAVREFGSHPALIVWCGNNEQEEGAWDWGYDRTGKSLPDYALYHHAIPVIMNREDGTRPYWPSSPYSPDHQPPTSPIVGDQHPWSVGFPHKHETNFWAYRTFVDRLPNEGGFLGASPLATLRQFLPEGERWMRSPSWEHHDNTINFWHPSLQVTYAAVRAWLGREPGEMTLEDYVVASGLLQAEALSEYIANYRRRMFSSAAAVFWMYNDSWPVTHGWTIVDYYRRKKLAYHPVRRANAPVTVVVAEEGAQVVVFGVNDTPHDWAGEVRYGLFTLAGSYLQDETQAVVLPANASTVLATIDRARWEAAGVTHAGAFAVLGQDGALIAQHRLLRARFKELAFVDPTINVSRQGDCAVFTADTFVWGICLDIDGDADVADNAFDLLPGIAYAIPWHGEASPLRIVRIGSRDILRRRGDGTQRSVLDRPE